ncbi:hypothetical protein TNCV_2775771 [Trichonephila clavipes]|nr:hypothetical protein TNCV_2775771 [Trichonephila clavipes]
MQRNSIGAVTINEKIGKNDKDVNIEDTVQTLKGSHSEGLKVADPQQKFEQQGASVMDSPFLRRLCDEVAKRSTENSKALRISLKRFLQSRQFNFHNRQL